MSLPGPPTDLSMPSLFRFDASVEWFTHVRLLIAHPQTSPQRLTTLSALAASVATGGRWSSERWVPVSWWSGGISVLVDESATAGRSCDLEVSIWLVCSVGGDGWSLIERTVGPVRVVMIDVVDDKIVELAAVPDDGAVEELASKGADPAFGERVRHGSAYRCLEDLAAFGSEDLVEGVDELAGAVAHERPASASWWPCWINRFRAAWVVQTPLGWSVIAAKYTVRVAMSMKNSR